VESCTRSCKFFSLILVISEKLYNQYNLTVQYFLTNEEKCKIFLNISEFTKKIFVLNF
jgi:hypothetical protein